MKKFTAISLFCGAGGLDMGFDRAGFKTIWANDFDKDDVVHIHNGMMLLLFAAILQRLMLLIFLRLMLCWAVSHVRVFH